MAAAPKLKRYTSREQIEAAIDKTIATGKRYLAKAAEMDAQADAWFKSGKCLPMANDFRLMADYKRKVGTALLESKAKKLGAKLSEFLTAPLIGDESVDARLRQKLPSRLNDKETYV